MTDLEDRRSEATPWFLQGNYAPVQNELTQFDLEVTGAIPPTLAGRYLRNGTNPASGTAGHWFFGDGMVHGVRLDGGKAEWYRNRWVQTTKLERGLEATDPEAMFDPTASAANTHVLGHAGRIWALEEGHLPYELTPELDTVGPDNFDGKLTTAFTAHPKLCPETGELHFFGYSPVAPFLTYHVLDATGALVHSAEITVPAGTMMHDFMITRDHAIFMDLPVVFDLSNLEAPLKWDDDYGARIGIVPRMGTDSDIRWFEIDPCYVFHPLNAYVDGDTVVCDVGRHASMWRNSMEDGTPSYLHRWTFDLATGAVGEQQLDGDSHAFPRVDDRVVGLQHRYGWGVAPRGGGDGAITAPGNVVKWDLRTGAQHTYDFGPNAFPGEFAFVQDDDAAGEDEGWVMGFVYDAAEDSSDLVILDGSAPGTEPVARVHLPQRVPFGFHGSWVDDSMLT
ncbi:MAG: carotenoid oxygenase family protein [Ilumatobacteraceae bacterium]